MQIRQYRKSIRVKLYINNQITEKGKKQRKFKK